MSRIAFALIALLAGCATADPGPAAEPASSYAAAAAASPVPTLAITAPPVAAEALVVDADGHAITVWAKVPAEPRDAIVLVHGRTWSAQPDFDLQVLGEQRSLMDRLLAQGFAVYAIDQRGYGKTPRDSTGWLTPDRAVADLAAVLKTVASRHPGLPKPALLGWSLGSLVAQLTVQRHPTFVSSVTLYGYPRDPAQNYSADSPGRNPEKRKTTAKAAAEDFIVPGTISQPAIDAFVAASVAADPVRMDWTGTQQWSALQPEAVQTPTLLIHGERDPYAPKKKQAALFERLGHADRQWVILAGCDHAAHLEVCGERFVHAVVQFVRRPVPRSAR